MFRRLHMPSFGYGLVAAALLTLVIGAAAKDTSGDARYDAGTIMGGLGLQIVDHESDVLYHYQRSKEGDRVNYDLYETINLSDAGEAQITPKTIKK